MRPWVNCGRAIPIRRSEKGFLAIVPDHGEVWFPFSQADLRPEDNETFTLFASEWILEQKGLYDLLNAARANDPGDHDDDAAYEFSFWGGY